MKKQMKRLPWLVLIVGCLASVALLTSVTLSRYAQNMDGYTDFSPANFNAAILEAEEGATGNVVTRLSAQYLRPGMEGDTSMRYQFRVANSSDGSNMAEVNLQYTIRIRTADSLPLEYSLYDKQTGITYYPSSKQPLAKTENAQTIYEHIFMLDGQEVQFVLERNEAWVYNTYELVVEWPRTETSVNLSYMKEVELVEILVTVTALNNLENDDYTTPPDKYPPDQTYSNGLIWILPPVQADPENPVYENQYTYAIDLRAFREDTMSGKGLYRFTVDNSVGQGAIYEKAVTKYTLQLKMPAELEDSYTFELWREDLDQVDSLLTGNKVYRIYDEKTGEQVGSDYDADSLSNAQAACEENKQRVYVIYEIDLGINGFLRNILTSSGGRDELVHDSHDYLMRINTVSGITGPLAFKNKLELLVHAEFVDSTT